ncbi:N-acetylmuramidase family protein [Chloroflexi bacterium TSY]|nr:N-acetylmuramidase family protein [Chloroflexi bacterium TSY]
MLVALNVRRSPGYIHKPANDVVHLLEVGEVVNLLRGPWQVDGLTWWQVDGLTWWQVDGGYVSDMAPSGLPLLQPFDEKKGEPDLLGQLAEQYGLEEKLARAVVGLESGGRGFSNGRLLIRFEAHVFLYSLAGAECHMGIDYFVYGNPIWTGHMYRAHVNEAFQEYHGYQDLEWHALEVASRINLEKAYASASYGAPQIMGVHWQLLGYSSPKAMVQAFEQGEDEQIRAMFRWMETTGCIEHLRAGRFLEFATIYNGAGQPEYYAEKLEKRLRIWSES